MTVTGSRRILIHGLNYAPEEIGIGPYTAGLAEWFAAAGHIVEVVAGNAYYPAWRARAGAPRGWSRRSENGVTVSRSPHYIPRHPTAWKRIIHHASFALASFLPLLRGAARKPDVVIAIVPSSIAARLALVAARFAHAKLWIHMQDLEIETALATGVAKTGSLSTRLGLALERALLARADLVTTIGPQMKRRILAKGVPTHKAAELRNWANHRGIVLSSNGDSLRQQWRLEDRFVALYSGNIGRKQGLDIVIEAARQLAGREDIVFVICGDGPNRQALERMAQGLATVRFESLQPVGSFGQLMRVADCHLLPQIAEATDLVLPSKLGNMLASARPVVATAAPGSGIAEELEGCGLVVAPGDAGQLADAVAALADDPAAAARLGGVAFAKAHIRWRREAVLARAGVLLDRLLCEP